MTKITDIQIGNFFNFTNELGEKVPVRVYGIENSVRMDDKTPIGIVKISGKTTTTSTVVDMLEPIPLTPEYLKKINCIVENDYEIKGAKKYGDTYVVASLVDVDYVLVPDWREQPSYFFGQVYTDSPFREDKNMVHTIMYNVKYLHELQNILHWVSWGEHDDYMYDDIVNSNL